MRIPAAHRDVLVGHINNFITARYAFVELDFHLFRKKIVLNVDGDLTGLPNVCSSRGCHADGRHIVGAYSHRFDHAIWVNAPVGGLNIMPDGIIPIDGELVIDTIASDNTAVSDVPPVFGNSSPYRIVPTESQNCTNS